MSEKEVQLRPITVVPSNLKRKLNELHLRERERTTKSKISKTAFYSAGTTALQTGKLTSKSVHRPARMHSQGHTLWEILVAFLEYSPFAKKELGD